MLKNIFLFKGKNFQDLNQLNVYSYPNEIIKISNTDLIGKIIYGHDHGELIERYRKSKKFSNGNNGRSESHIIPYMIDTPIAQVINNLNIYTTCINGSIIVGLIFDDEDDNPYDYKQVFTELLDDILNIEKSFSFEEEIDIENLMISVFIDIRRYGEEYIKEFPEFENTFHDSFTKVFLFGIDEVGKSSLLRRIKTDEYNDNYFPPTKKFNIEYIQDTNIATSWWDMPGQRIFRKKWLLGMQDSNVLVFMIDIADQLRFEEAKLEFWDILNRYDLLGIPLLILGNKIDLIDKYENNQEHLDTLKNELTTLFELDKIENRQWDFIFTSVKTNFNIQKITETLNDLISN